MARIFIFGLLFYVVHANAQEYYPLSIGNRWEYREDYDEGWGPYSNIDTFAVNVIDTITFPNGKLYYKLDDIDISWGEYVRVDSAGVHYWATDDSSYDVLLYKFDATIGDFWFAHLNATYSVGLSAIDTVDIFGESTRIMIFSRDGLIMSTVTLSEKFGPVFFESPGEPPGTSWTDTDILGCRISGTTYGLLSSVNTWEHVPLAFSLHQNYPNPFNPVTTIEYQLPLGANVSLRVYNLLGQGVAVLVDDFQEAGYKTVEFDASDLPSGAYLYRLTAGDFVETKKLVVLK